MHGTGSRRTTAFAAVLAALCILGVTGCVDEGSGPDRTSSANPTAGPTGNPTPTAPPEPELVEGGTAEQNRPYFDLVNERLIAAGGVLDGRAFIDNLVAAGYPKADMEVTFDRTAINGAADNVQFSVRLGQTCLLGQYGKVGYASFTAPVLGTGRCLIGTTRPIDW